MARLALDPVLDRRRDPVRLVEAADRDGDAVAIEHAVEQRRPAIAAEAALDGVRASEAAGLAARPVELGHAHAGERRDVAAEGLLAHAAMADRRVRRLGVERVAHRAALAAAGHHGACSFMRSPHHGSSAWQAPRARETCPGELAGRMLTMPMNLLRTRLAPGLRRGRSRPGGPLPLPPHPQDGRLVARQRDRGGPRNPTATSASTTSTRASPTTSSGSGRSTPSSRSSPAARGFRSASGHITMAQALEIKRAHPRTRDRVVPARPGRPRDLGLPLPAHAGSPPPRGLHRQVPDDHGLRRGQGEPEQDARSAWRSGRRTARPPRSS